eukprot:1157485-Pelagomonas_calceolata.AAC.2
MSSSSSIMAVRMLKPDSLLVPTISVIAALAAIVRDYPFLSLDSGINALRLTGFWPSLHRAAYAHQCSPCAEILAGSG